MATQDDVRSEEFELAERCEKATGPDPVLEREIAEAMGWKHKPNKGPERDFFPYVWVAPDGSCNADVGFPDYLTSIDAAMTLVPEGWERLLRDEPDGIVSACLYSPDTDDESFALARSWPLALCAASLRARAHLPTTEDDNG